MIIIDFIEFMRFWFEYSLHWYSSCSFLLYNLSLSLPIILWCGYSMIKPRISVDFWMKSYGILSTIGSFYDFHTLIHMNTFSWKFLSSWIIHNINGPWLLNFLRQALILIDRRYILWNSYHGRRIHIGKGIIYSLIVPVFIHLQ